MGDGGERRGAGEGEGEGEGEREGEGGAGRGEAGRGRAEADGDFVPQTLGLDPRARPQTWDPPRARSRTSVLGPGPQTLNLVPQTPNPRF